MRTVSIGWLICIVTTLASACQSNASESASTPKLEDNAGGPNELVESSQAAYWRDWENGAHASTYALNKGPNTYCAKCHSPLNWDPAAEIDPPPNCVSCKFPNEPEIREAESNPLVSDKDWKHIGCEICHRMENGDADPEPMWFDARTGFYETVASSSQLCTECHQDNETLRHDRNLGRGAHSEFSCTSCHDAHTLSANCSNVGCHSDIEIPHPGVRSEHLDQTDESKCTKCHGDVAGIHMDILSETPVFCMDCHGSLMGGEVSGVKVLGHGQVHESVKCVACHDASNLTTGPTENGEWTTFRTVQLLGRSTTEPYKSHNIQRGVECDRCHFPENPWELVADDHNLIEQPGTD